MTSAARADLAAVDLDDPVAGLDAGRRGGRFRAASGDDRLAGVEVRALQADARQAGIQVFALFNRGRTRSDVFRRDGEADARIVPLDAGHFVGGLGESGTSTPSTRPRMSTSGPP